MYLHRQTEKKLKGGRELSLQGGNGWAHVRGARQIILVRKICETIVREEPMRWESLRKLAKKAVYGRELTTDDVRFLVQSPGLQALGSETVAYTTTPSTVGMSRKVGGGRLSVSQSRHGHVTSSAFQCKLAAKTHRRVLPATTC